MSRFGFEGLLGRADVLPLRIEDVRGILPRGGSILGCSTKSNPFASAGDGKAAIEPGVLLRALQALAVDGLVLAGGDGTMAIARSLGEMGVRCVGIPKTIDGDLDATEQTCGIDTAVETATRAIDALHSTAEAHQRVMIVEVMGRDSGWIALRAGIAGGADAVLIPEIPYDPARDVGHEVRVTVLGHLQRGGTPTDRLLATRFGAHAAELCAERRFGRMVAPRAGEIDSVELAEVPHAPRIVDRRGELVRCARAIGIEVGEER